MTDKWTDKWFSNIGGAPGDLTLADVCDQIEQKIHLNADNEKLPQEFPDWQSCVRDRDATIYKLSAGCCQPLSDGEALGIGAAARRLACQGSSPRPRYHCKIPVCVSKISTEMISSSTLFM
jgi:hypothetical protein